MGKIIKPQTDIFFMPVSKIRKYIFVVGGVMSGPNKNNAKGMFENIKIRQNIVKPFLRPRFHTLYDNSHIFNSISPHRSVADVFYFRIIPIIYKTEFFSSFLPIPYSLVWKKMIYGKY